MTSNESVQERAINTIRFLSADGVQKANSGHPGLPMGTAALAYTIWMRHLRFNPRNPQWPDYGVQFIGHNVMDFDLRFIYQRSIIHRVKPAYELNFARYRNYPIYDTMKEWVKWSNSAVGLEKIALALGIPTPKDGIDGSQVYEFYKQGKANDILEYCKRDVEATRSVFKRMNFEE